MTIEDAVKGVGSYFHLQNFVIENSFLFSDGAFKVILNLLSRLDYSMKNTVVVMSYTELQEKTLKHRGVIQKCIQELIQKGFIQKISGKYQKEFARYQREALYKQPQKPLRSYNEINAYDLKSLIAIASLWYKLSKLYEKSLVVGFFHQVKRYYEITKKSILDMLMGVFYTALPDIPIGICLLSISQKEMYLLSTSDIPLQSTSDILPQSTSDVLNYVQYHSRLPEPLNHTHTPAAAENDLEGRTLAINGGRAIFKQEGQAIEGQGQEQAQDNILPSTPISQPKKKKGKEEKMSDELREFILKDLLQKERDGAIKSANAIMKSLTDEDIEMYAQKLEDWKREQEKQKEATQRAAWKVLCFSKDQMLNASKMKAVFGENWKETFEAKKRKKELKEHSYYVYLKVKTSRVNDIIAKAQQEMLYVNEYELTKEYEEFFNS